MLSKSSFVFISVLLSFIECGNDTTRQFSGSNSKGSSFKVTESGFVSFLENFKGSSAVNINNSPRGGNFKLVSDNKLQDDYGITFPATAKGSNWHWVRQYENDEPVNIKWFGAKGIGLAGYKDDSAAIVKAVHSLESKGGGKLYFPATKSFYGFNGDGILLPDNIEIYGDGPQSVITHVNPENADYYKGVIFYTTTYGPVDAQSIFQEPMFEIEDAKKGDNFIVLKTKPDSLKLNDGKLIGLGGGLFNKRGQSNKSRFTQFEINEITKVDGNKVYLKYPLSVPLKTMTNKSQETGNATSVPVLVDINGNHSFNKKLNAYDRISKNIYIHDLTLAQEDHNSIANTPYNSEKAPSSIIGLGGTFESKFQNLTLEGYNSFLGNLWNRCDISNLKIYAVRKFTDFGYGSANTKMHDITWVYKASKIRETVAKAIEPGERNKDIQSFIYINDGTHDIEIYNVKASGNWDGENIFQIAGGAHHINIHDVEINLPQFNNVKGEAVNIRDDNAVTFSHDINFKNVTLTLGNIKQFVTIRGTNQVVDDKLIQFDNVSFNGRPLNKNSVNIANSTGVILNKVSVSNGNILLDNSADAKITNLNAPNSDIIDQNNRGKKSEVIASKYRAMRKM
ncbi:MAG: hypothetical protein JO072_03005 [Parafilimonas sp.]|nr:hypothetical protein [Parafilimonas sp.]